MCLLILHVLILLYLYDNNKKQILNLDIKFYFKNTSVCLDILYFLAIGKV